MQNELMGEVVFASQYARQTEGGRESWSDAVDRVVEMHVEKYPQLEDEIKDAFNLVKEKRVVPSQRSMQFGGKAIKQRNMRIYNCTYSPADRPRFFSEMFWLLLCGCGTGFSVKQNKDTSKNYLESYQLNNIRCVKTDCMWCKIPLKVGVLHCRHCWIHISTLTILIIQ
jgi:hypothetical protein